MDVCTECNVENELFTGKPDKDGIKTREVSGITVKPTERQRKRGEASTIEEFTVEQTKKAYYEGATQVGMRRSEIHVAQNRPLV